MTRTKLISAALALVLAATGFGGLLDRVESQSDKVASAYAETWNTFYGVGHYKNLLTASLDVRPDGTPNIVLDKQAGDMTVTIRLAVNETNYEAWKKATHERFAALNMSYRFSDFEDPEGRMIGGKNYRFGDNEEASLKRWEAKSGNAVKAELFVHVQLVDKAGKTLREDLVSLKAFKRLGFASYPIPLHNLNRLHDLPRTRFKWTDSDKEPTRDSHVEDGYARLAYAGLTPAEMKNLEDVRCTVLDAGETASVRMAIAKRSGAGRTKTITLPGGAQLELVWCPAGKGLNGNGVRGFWIGKTEVTQKQWESVMGENPSHFKGTDRPVEQVSWNDCKSFCVKAGLGLRLPTEQEWEYACRAGSKGDWGKRANGEEGPLESMGWYDDNSGNETHSVAQKEPNAWGLYDMHGNVWEWCEDAVGENRVYRGGSWYGGSGSCAAGDRGWDDPDDRYNYLGFRLACSQD